VRELVGDVVTGFLVYARRELVGDVVTGFVVYKDNKHTIAYTD